MKFTDIINDFSSGELGPKLEGDITDKEYKNGSRRMENFLPYRGRGTRYRPGKVYKGKLDFGSGTDLPAILIPFTFSVDEVYVIAIRCAEAIVTSSQALRTVRVFEEVNGNFVEVGCEDRELTDFGWDFTGLDYLGFQHVQIGDVVTLVHNSGQMMPLIIARTFFSPIPSLTVFKVFLWTTVDPTTTYPFAYTNYGVRFPYRDMNIDTTHSLTPDAANATSITSSKPYFDAGMIGSPIKITQTTKTGIAVITGVTNEFIATVITLIQFDGATASIKWEEAAWSDYRGWPRTIVYHNGALWMSGPLDTVYKSRTGGIYHFMQSKLLQDASTDVSGIAYAGAINDSDAYSFIPAQSEVNIITWMNSDRALMIGTLASEYVAVETGTYATTKIPINCKNQTNHGGSSVMSAKADHRIFYVTADGKKIRETWYSDENGSYVSRDLSVLNDEIIYHGRGSASYRGTTIKQIKWQEDIGVLWCLTSNGTIIGLSYDSTIGLQAWHKITFGGSGVAMSIVVLTEKGTTRKTLYTLVRRTINAANYYSFESLPEDYPGELMGGENSSDLMRYLDSGKYKVYSEGYRYLEDGTKRLLEDSTERIME